MTIEEARIKWIAESAQHAQFGRIVAARMQAAVNARGMFCEVSSRAKDLHSLVKKLLKGKHTYDSMSDKVGARCIVRYLSDIEPAIDAARGAFDCREIDRKAEAFGEDELGYLSVHADVRLRAGDPELVQFEGYRAELQIRTHAQHLWSEMSHDSFYKNDARVVAFPKPLWRRIYLMAGLIEVADQEFDRLNQATRDDVAEIYRVLEQQYYKLTSQAPDVELSLTIIALLMPLYGPLSAVEVQTRIKDYFSSHEVNFRTVLGSSVALQESALLSQPEIFMLVERLDDDRVATKNAWNQVLPPSELERVAHVFGISLD